MTDEPSVSAREPRGGLPFGHANSDAGYRRAIFWLIASQLLAYFALGTYCALSERYLFADGSHFLIGLLQTQAVAEWYPARQHAHLVTQLPAVVAMKLGCHDVNVIGATYGATLCLLPVAALSFTWWSARTAPVDAMLFPMLSHAAITLDTSFFAIAESHVTVALFWCELFLLLYSERFTIGRALALIAISFLATRTNEGFVFLAWPLVTAASVRGWRAFLAGRRADSLVFAASAALAAYGFAIALDAGLHPRDPAGRSQFVESLTAHASYLPVRLSVTTVAVTLALLFRRWPIWIQGALTAIIAVFGAAVALIPFVAPDRIAPCMQYVARVQHSYLPLVLGGALTIVRMRAIGDGKAETRPTTAWALATWLAAVAVVFHVGSTRQWERYVSLFVSELSGERGLVSFHDSSLSGIAKPSVSDLAAHLDRGEPAPRDNRARDGSITQFNWGWTMPTMSVALGALHFGSVATLVENEGPTGWEPFNPRDPDAIPRLDAYGITTRWGAPNRR